jgi:chromosome segregation ATPase
MAKSKKELTDLEKVTKEFKEDLNDKELQNRFDRFEKTLAHLKESYNEHVPEVNQKMKMSQDLAQMILDSAMMGFLNNDAISKVKEVNSYLDGIRPHLDNLQRKMEEEKGLIEKYKENSKNKFFHYWKIFKAIDPTTEPWMEWFKQYEKNII